MAKDGQVDSTTTNDKAFAGPGVEGQKGADTSADTQKPSADKEVKPSAEGEEKASADEGTTKNISFDTEGATSVVTLRDGPKRVWFRDGKEIGVEDAG